MTKAREAIKRARKALGLNGPDQRDLIRKAKAALGMTTAELADALGKSEDTLLAWLAPEGTAKHRTMPEGSRLLLAHIVAAGKKARH